MKVYETMGLGKNEAKTGPLLGLECETEGQSLPGVFDYFWTTVQDGSLRGGLEYVSIPLKPAQVDKALNQLHKKWVDENAKIKYSFRCSTHVHVNTQDMTLEQLMCMIFLYMMYENVFMNLVADERVGNRFCLRFQDAQHLTNEVSHMFTLIRQGEGVHALRNLRQDALKYAAFNLHTLRKYGTLEFRALEGTQDVAKIAAWTEAIVRLRSTSMKWDDPAALYEAFVNDPTELADNIFGHAPERFLKPGWQAQVEEGYSQNQAVLMSL